MAGRTARIRAILRALIRAVRRDLKSVGSFSGNNLFVAAMLFLLLGDPQVFTAVGAFIGLVLFIPLSADPLRVVPADRLAVWPLSEGERRLLRILSPWLNPLMWLLIGLAIWKRITMSLLAVAAGVFALGFVLPSLRPLHKGVCRRLPNFPGLLNHLIRKNLRETFSTLDFWCSAVISLFAFGFRIAGLIPPASRVPLTIIVLLAFSTYTQTLFGLDGDRGMMRYRLLPLHGWQVLAGKDLPFVLAAVVMTLPLDPVAGLAGALTALAIGHHFSVIHRSNQVRWRFSSGISGGSSLLQIIAMVGAAAGVGAMPWLMVVCAAGFGASLWWYGQNLESFARPRASVLETLKKI